MRNPTVGDVVAGKLVLKREIARGGVGIVFEARHSVMGAAVAVKLLQAVHRDPVLQSRLLREGQVLALVRSAGVVQVYDVGEDPEFGPYLVLEMLEGRPLDGFLAARSRLPLEEAVRMTLQVAETLSLAHARGVLHRDIKPPNIFIVREGRGARAKLLDFGIAATESAEQSEAKLTRPGQVFGTYEYMSLEQLMGGANVDQRADVYGLAATLYECLSTQVPMPGTYPDMIAAFARGERPKPLSELEPGIPLAVSHALEHALRPTAKERFADMDSFAHALMTAAKVEPGPLSLLTGARGDAAESASPSPASITAQHMSRRKFPRAPYLTPVHVARPSPLPAVAGKTQDVSQGGALLILPTKVEAGEVVGMRFVLPSTTELTRVDAVVRWAREARAGQFAVGVAFQDPSEQVRKAIDTYVAWFGVHGEE